MINNSLFKLDELPKFHPVINKYDRIAFYKEQKRCCMEGFWVGGKWIPGELYYYINFHNIILEKGTYKGLGLPLLRDIDFEIFYVFTEAIGFSGFSDDVKYTCHRAVKELEKGEITKEDLILNYCTDTGKLINKIYDSLFNAAGEIKKYTPAREYLNKIQSSNLGKPVYFNEAKHFLILGARGFGKSYSCSGLINANFLFDGCHNYDDYMEAIDSGKPMKSETGVGAIDAKYSGDLLSKAKIALENLPDSHIIREGKFDRVYPSLLMQPFSGSFAPSKTLTANRSKSTIHHRTLQDNPLVFNGTRPNRIFLDEVGFISNLLEAWEAIEATQASERFKRLSIIGMGTGGLTSGGAALYSHEIFYNPDQYGCLVFDDIWENKGAIGKFVPATKALNKFKEGPNLITNEDRALKAILDERDKARKSPTRTKLMGTVINKPIVPSEIFLRMEGTVFSVLLPDLRATLENLEKSTYILSSTYKYEMQLVDGRVVPKLSDKSVIREFPLPRGFNMDSPIEVYELPKRNTDGEVFTNRYIAGWDPIDVDDNTDTSQSLQSLIVLDSWTDRIVAEYTSRTYLAKEYYEQARRLLIWYKAVCNYEQNLKGAYTYFSNKNSLYLLCDTPEILSDKSMITVVSIGNKSKGTRVGGNKTGNKIVSLGEDEILAWLDSPSYANENIHNLTTIKSPALIRELIGYSRDVNTDRVSALIMLMILRADRDRITDISRTQSIKTKASDSMWFKAFNKNYNKTAKLVY